MEKKKYNLRVMRNGATKAKSDQFKPCPKPEQTPGDSEGQEAWHAAVHGIAKSQT